MILVIGVIRGLGLVFVEVFLKLDDVEFIFGVCDFEVGWCVVLDLRGWV